MLIEVNKFQEIKHRALEEHIPIIMDDTLEYLDKLFLKSNIDNILEIGTAVGYSAICFSRYLSENGKIDTIERDEDRAKEALQNISSLNLQEKINIILGDAIDILPSLNKKYDMIFIDAAKGKYPYFLNEALRMSNKGTIIVADNVLYKGYVMSDYNKHKQRTAVRNLREYLKEALENPRLNSEILEIGDGLCISKVI